MFQLLKRISSAAFFLFAVAGGAAGQETAPAQPDSTVKAAKETVPFVITGDRLPTVEYTPERLDLPLVTRPVHATGGLPRDGSAVRRVDTAEVWRGLHASAEGWLGARTPLNLGLSASYDEEDRAATLRFSSRSQKENTSTNLAPSVREISGSGYYDAPYGDISFNLGLRSEREEVFSDRFRSRDRRMERYTGDIGILTVPFASWDLRGRLALSGGRYRDDELHTSRGELNLEGETTLSGVVEEVSVTAVSRANYLRLGTESGSLFSLGGAGEVLPLDGLGIRAGAMLTVSAMPGKEGRVRFYPEVSADWTISPRTFAKLAFKPRVITHSFGDIYSMNGLVTTDVPLLYEDRSLDLTADYGVRLLPDLTCTAGVFVTRSANAPVFSGKGDLFEIVPGARVTTSGIHLGAEYSQPQWGADGQFTTRDASWNFSGDVPYIPMVELEANAHLIPRELWLLRGSARYTGKHYTVRDSDATEKGFLTLDVGAEREFPWYHTKATLEIRNLLNSRGAWWTGEYRMPGIGLYAGLTARY